HIRNPARAAEGVGLQGVDQGRDCGDRADLPAGAALNAAALPGSPGPAGRTAGLRTVRWGHIAPAKDAKERGSMNQMATPVTHHEALIYTMVTLSAADRSMTDKELLKIGDIV